MKKKLFTPGPIEVREDVLQKMAFPMISHRGPEYRELHRRVRAKLRQVLGLQKGHVFLVTSSSTGAMEMAVRNLVPKRVLSVTCGAFGERWRDIAVANGIEAETLSAEWGRGNHAEEIRRALRERGPFDAITIVHSETSTGVLNRLAEAAEVLREFPDTFFLVDAVSSMAGVPIEIEAWGIDCVFAGVQKAWGMPPGLTVCVASDRAIERASRRPARGFYFDLAKFQSADAKDETPETPAISLIATLDFQLDRMLAEGMENRFRRTREMAERCRAWGREHGFRLFPEEGYEGVTLTCFENTAGVDTAKLAKELDRRGYTISEGYGKLKGKTFRIAHMGDISMSDLDELLGHASDILRGK